MSGEVGVSEGEWDVRSFEASLLFSPSAPINEHELFAGRGAQVRKILEAAVERGKHVVLFGERGVGKTSIAQNFHTRFPTTLKDMLVVREQVDPSDSFSSIWRKVFKDVEVRSRKDGGDANVTLESLVEGDITPDDVRRLLQPAFGPNSIPVIVIDEFDKAVDASIHTLMANTLKSLSDYSTNVTILLVGVADDINELVGEHPSITRCIEQVPMPRMNAAELREILDERVPKLGMSMTDGASSRIIELSRGMPSYTHSLGLYSVQAACARRSFDVTGEDVVCAIRRTLEKTQESTRNAYGKATNSNRSDNLYRQVLLACALAEADDHGHFTPLSVCAPLSRILGRDVRIDGFQQHLLKFITPDRASILTRKGKERAYRFRFQDPMMQPYVVMRGMAEGLAPEGTA